MLMGLLLQVGALARGHDPDPEYVAYLRKMFASANRTLKSNGLPQHTEPENQPPIREQFNVGSMPYGRFERLKRAVAYARNSPKRFRPLREGKDPFDNAWVVHEMCCMESHLICHSYCDGLYLPMDFERPLISLREYDIAHEGLGSSVAGLGELRHVAPLLGIELKDGKLGREIGRQICREKEGDHPFEVERKTWLAFFEAFTLSVKHKSAVLLT
jgi:hypothetical protein